MHDHKKNGSSAITITLLPVAQQHAIREQLDRILANSLFRNSKRVPDFLRYTVEQTLNGNAEEVKERTIGVDVFGRTPDYDTTLDPVVRMAAVEVRKRLAQYYQGPGREYEVVIDYSRGSYVPEFRFPDAPVVASAPDAAEPIPTAKNNRMRLAVYALVAIAALTLCSWALIASRRQTPVERFWEPVTSSPLQVTLCIPDLASFGTSPDRRAPTAVSDAVAQLPAFVRRDRVSFGDSTALSMMASVLGSKTKSFRVFHTEDATLDDLMQGPVILIGGFSNKWTLQFGSKLRYSFIHEGALHYIIDQKNPTSRDWALQDWDGADFGKATSDFALISRVSDPTTGRILVTVAGIHQFGTEAAGRCLADSQCLGAAEKLAPGDWQHKNLQLVLQTSVIDGNPGQPHVLAAYLW